MELLFHPPPVRYCSAHITQLCSYVTLHCTSHTKFHSYQVVARLLCCNGILSSKGQPSAPTICLALPPRSMRCSSMSWQSAQDEARLFGSKNNASSPLWALMWWHTVAMVTLPRPWHRSHRGCLANCCFRSASHLPVLYSARHGFSCRRRASYSRLRFSLSSGLGNVGYDPRISSNSAESG